MNRCLLDDDLIDWIEGVQSRWKVPSISVAVVKGLQSQVVNLGRAGPFLGPPSDEVKSLRDWFEVRG